VSLEVYSLSGEVHASSAGYAGRTPSGPHYWLDYRKLLIDDLSDCLARCLPMLVVGEHREEPLNVPLIEVIIELPEHVL